MKNKILNLAKSAVWLVLCLLVGALIFEGIRSFANINKPAKRVGISVITEEEHDYLVVDTKHGVCVIHAESCPCHKKKQRMKKDIFNKATKLSRNIEEINKVIDSSNDLKHPCYRSLFSSSLLTLMDDDDFNKHFLSFLKNEKNLNEEMFNSL